jgi:hypothetical protein
MDQSLITAVEWLDPTTLVFGSYPSGIHIVDLRDRSTVVCSGSLPKAPFAAQATPLCIKQQGTREHQVMVCGRFPSFLLYDLRAGMDKCRSVYSGAESLSSMTYVSRDRIVVGGSYRGKHFSCHVC